MSRSILDSSKIHSAIAQRVDNYYSSVVQEVQRAMEHNNIVVVGMKGNPHCRKARKLLESKDAEYLYMEYGSYLGEWRRRSALKMWTGWPTFPMVFHEGTLIGGATELDALVESGEVKV